MSVSEVAVRLGVSLAHVERLIEVRELELGREGDGPLIRSVEAFEQRRGEASARISAWSRSLDGLGCPPE